MKLIDPNITHWSNVRETDDRVGEAIWTIATERPDTDDEADAAEAQRIWEEPTDTEMARISAMLPSGDNYGWGAGTIKGANPHRVIIRVDYEHIAEAWWDSVKSHPDPPESVRPLIDFGGPDFVEVSPAENLRIQEWAHGLAGWQKEFPALIFNPPYLKE